MLERLGPARHPGRGAAGRTAALMDALPRVQAWQAENGPPSRLHDILTRLPLEGLLYLIARADCEELRKKLTLYVYQGRQEKPDVSGAGSARSGPGAGPRVRAHSQKDIGRQAGR